MNIYIDESIHEKFGFMLLAYVLCKKDPQEYLCDLLTKHDVHEFHSCQKMEQNRVMQELRQELVGYVNSNCKWGVLSVHQEELMADWKLVMNGEEPFKIQPLQ